jgi:hypothetical protein
MRVFEEGAHVSKGAFRFGIAECGFRIETLAKAKPKTQIRNRLRHYFVRAFRIKALI